MKKMEVMLGVCIAMSLKIGATLLQDNQNTNTIKEEIINTTNTSAKDLSKLGEKLHNPKTGKKALDSLKIKSAVDDAYFNGIRMVRDSIKTASKIAK